MRPSVVRLVLHLCGMWRRGRACVRGFVVALTPDRKPGVGDQEGVDFEVAASLATAEGEVRYNSGRFSFYDSVGEYDPRAGGGYVGGEPLCVPRSRLLFR